MRALCSGTFPSCPSCREDWWSAARLSSIGCPGYRGYILKASSIPLMKEPSLSSTPDSFLSFLLYSFHEPCSGTQPTRLGIHPSRLPHFYCTCFNSQDLPGNLLGIAYLHSLAAGMSAVGHFSLSIPHPQFLPSVLHPTHTPSRPCGQILPAPCSREPKWIWDFTLRALRTVTP